MKSYHKSIFEHEKEIIQLYTIEQKNCITIGDMYDVWPDNIKKVLIKNNIDIRREGFKKGNKPFNKGKTAATCNGILKQTVSRRANFLNGKYTGSFKGKKHSVITKKKISQSMLGNKNATHRVDRQNFYKNCRMDSKWEIATAQYFDKHSINWKYNEFGFLLENGSYYYPDFFIYENKKLLKLVEVKGLFREKNKQKFELFKKNYPEIVIELWTRPELYKRGIIDINGYAGSDITAG